jgi:2-oxoglutarate/2-oxoacid ferredoxin oxidoreductase subunit alpha
MNLGQLAMLIRAKYLVDVVSYAQVRGMPLGAAELARVIGNLVEEAGGSSGVGAAAASLPHGATDLNGGVKVQEEVQA